MPSSIADPDEYLPSRRVVLRFRLDGADRIATASPFGALPSSSKNRRFSQRRYPYDWIEPSLAMPVDLDVGDGDFVRRLEQFGASGQRNQNVSLRRRAALPLITIIIFLGFLCDRSIKLGYWTRNGPSSTASAAP